MKAFVTGGSGLLGSNLVRLLVEQGYEVKALVRSRKKADLLLGDLDVQYVEGDMQNVAGFAAELEGCDVLFHTAAYFSEYYQPGDHWQQLEDINIKGTVNLLVEAERHGIKKAIYTSSVTVLGALPNGQQCDENTPPGKEQEWNLYSKSKLLAEKAVARFLQQHQLPVVLIMPSNIFGPGDLGSANTGMIVQSFLARRIPGIIDTGLSVVDARDVAQAMIKAVDKGKSGERYIVGGHYFDMADLLKQLEAVSGIPAPTWRIPYVVSLLIATFAQTISRIRGRSTLVSVESVRNGHLKRRVSSEKAKRELGVTFRPFAETLRDEIAWYRTHDPNKEKVPASVR